MNEKLLSLLEEFIAANYVTVFFQGGPPDSLEDNIGNHLTFGSYLFPLIDAKGLTDVECYKRARLDRRTFSKIKTDREYHPSRETVCAFAIALELDLAETQQLLNTAGYYLSRTRRYDIIIAFFIKNRIYDIDEINEALELYKEPIFK